MFLFAALTNLLYPPACRLCDAPSPAERTVCRRCERALPATLAPACQRCGVELRGAFDARSVWKTDDGALIYVTYSGRTLIPADVGAAFRDPAQPHVDPSRYLIRIAPVFETADPRYAWLNAVLGVGCGERTATGINHFIYAIT